MDIKECASSPCQNAGICLELTLNRYDCLCPAGKEKRDDGEESVYSFAAVLKDTRVSIVS